MFMLLPSQAALQALLALSPNTFAAIVAPSMFGPKLGCLPNGLLSGEYC